MDNDLQRDLRDQATQQTAKPIYPKSPVQCASYAHSDGMCKVCAYCACSSREGEICHFTYCHNKIEYILYRYKDGVYYDCFHSQDNQLAKGLPIDLPSNTGSTSSVLHDPSGAKPPEALAKRDPLDARYDVIYPLFIRAMAMIGAYGVEHYGEGNWKKSRLTDDKSPVNHMQHHLIDYQTNTPYDHPEVGEGRLWHLAAIAFNAMMEFYYEDTHTK